MRSTLLRPIAGAAILGCAAFSLAACGSSSSPSDKDSSAKVAGVKSGCDGLSSGATSDAVKVAGSLGTKTPKITFKKPLKAKGLQRTVLTKGTGASTAAGDVVNTMVTVYLGTGKSLGTQPLSLAVESSSIPKAFAAGAACLPIGTRSVVTDTAKDVYGAAGDTQYGIKATDSLVIVTDVLSKKKALKVASWTKNRAKVTFAKSGKASITLPKVAAPKQLEMQILKKGTGAVVKSGDEVSADYAGEAWGSGKIFQQTFGATPASLGTDQVVPGFGAALVGQKVGTRLIVSIPQKYAYGAKTAGNSLSGKTLVFLIDIKSITTSK